MGILQKILPTTGVYCVAEKLERGFKHWFCLTIGEAEQTINAINNRGQTVYLAQSSFKTTANRKGENASHVRSFWMDIDCGPEKFEADPNHSYPTQRDGANALAVFCEVTGLPLPMITNSGNGLYAHWCLTNEILPDQWKSTAQILKKLCFAHGFKADPTRTADLASVLRPPGATNRKHGEKLVAVIRDAEPIEFTQFAGYLRDAAKRENLDVTALQPPKASELNDEFSSGLEGPPSKGVLVADHCSQIARMRDTKGDMPEPDWYACIGVLRYCEEGAELIHEWSSGHAEYSPAETARKIEQWKMPPTTCQYFGQMNPAGCVGCKHASKIKTPIVLGRDIPVVDPVTTDPERAELPAGYVLTQEGLFSEEDMIRFYPHDIYPRLVAADTSMGVETVMFKHYLPHEGWQEFSLRSGILRDQKALLMALQDNHVGVDGKLESNFMADYLQRYVNKLRSNRKIARLFDQMGWKKDLDSSLSFVVGDRLLRKDGSIETVGLARNVPGVAKYFCTSGDKQAWINETRHLRGRHGHAFALLAGFAAPLMQFAGYEGATISMVGESGIGKTLMTRMAQSIYGYFPELMMSQEDTRNALISRLGIYGSLPFTIDEVSNIDPMELSDLVYRITQGRDKARLTRHSVEKPNNNQWRTLAIVSSNHSLVEKLGSAKSDASAEMNRVFEYTVERDPTLTKEIMTGIHHCMLQNYGYVGEEYLSYVVQNQDRHAENIEKILRNIDQRVDARVEERYLSAVIAVVAYAGMIAEKLGLIQFEVAPVVEWAVKTMRSMREEKQDLIVDSVSVLGQFLDKHAPNMLVLNQTRQSQGAFIERHPRGAVGIRYEIDTNKLYISRDFLKTYLHKTFGSYNKLKLELENMNPSPLVKSDGRKVLGANAAGYGGASQYVWEIDLNTPGLGNIMPTLHEFPAEQEDMGKVIPMRRRAP